jgi:hypothetical protein
MTRIFRATFKFAMFNDDNQQLMGRVNGVLVVSISHLEQNDCSHRWLFP